MSETHAGAQSYRAGPWSCRLSDCLDPEPHIHSQQSLADNIDALKAENEALKAQWIDHTKPGCGPSSAYCEELRAKLSLYTSWQPSDPGTKEAMEWFREPGPFEADAHGRVLAHAIRAAMVRLEEAEKRIERGDADVVRILSDNAALTASLASMTHELEETKRWLQEEGARGNTCRAENAALAKEIERNKYEFEVSHRVVQAHKQAEQNAVRIGCENITAREKAEAALAAMTKERDMANWRADSNFENYEYEKQQRVATQFELAGLRKRMGREESCICTRIPSKNWHLDKCPAAIASPPSPAPVESNPKEGKP